MNVTDEERRRKTCEVKVRYETARAAIFFGDARIQRAYRCPFCEGWHLSSRLSRRER